MKTLTFGRLILLLVSLMALLALSSCAQTPAPETPPADEAEEAPEEEPAQEPAEEPAGEPAEEPAEEAQPGEPVRGGVVRVAIPADPTNIDPHVSSTGLEHRTVGWHIFEGLFTTDAATEIVPLLAESYEVNADGTVYTVKIREGVKFHDGSDLTSEDVVASLQRWLQMGGRMANMLQTVIEDPESGDWIQAVDDYTVQATFTEANVAFMQGLSTIRQGAYIVPSEIIEEWGTELATNNETYIGTGPFRLAEWIPDEVIRLERFEDYQPRDEEPLGYGGRRVAYLDAIEFLPIPDASIRASSLEVGDIEVMMYGSVADLERLRDNPDVVFVRGAPSWYDHAYFNLTNGIFSVEEGERALKLRQAVQAAIDVEEIAGATYGDPALYRLDPGYMWQETRWWCDDGSEFYNQANPELAQQLMEEAGYNNEPIRIRSSGDFGELLTWTEVFAEQLRSVGFNVEIINMDNAAYTDAWFVPEGWEISALFATFRDDPILLPQYPLSDIFGRPTQEEYPELYEMLDQLISSTTFEERLAFQCEFQQKFYEEALHLRLADVFEVRFADTGLSNFQNTPEIFLWNVWLAEEE